MIGYIKLKKDNGKDAWIRADEIAAFSENETKVGKETVRCVTVLLRNNVAWHFAEITPDDLMQLMKSATGAPVHVTDLGALGR